MPPRRTLSTRWVAVIMAAALVCSVAVVWSLIQLTGGTSASSSTPAAPVSGTSSDAVPAAVSGTAATGAIASSTLSAARPTTAGVPRSDDLPNGPLTSTASQRTSASATNPNPTVLPGSGLALPAAWTGTAEMTITVLGRCAEAGGTSSYTRDAELALQRPAAGSGPIGDANPLSLTLGITPTEVPGLSLYSAATDGDGTVRRTWWLATGTSTPDGSGRTQLSGVLIDDQPVDGVLPPNLLVDSETDLQPCETSGTVRVPRILAAGSTLTGWVSATAGHLDLKSSTTDGERAVTAVVTLSRRVGT